MNTGPVGIRVTLGEIYDNVTTTATKVAEIESIVRHFNGHEDRIRKLETTIAGVLVIQALQVAGITAIITQFFIGR